MRIIQSGRASGKTIELIKLSHENRGYIVCVSKHRCTEIQETAMYMGLDIPFPLSFKEFIEGSFYGRGIREFYIDDADVLLYYMSKNVPVHTVTISSDCTKIINMHIIKIWILKLLNKIRKFMYHHYNK